VVWKAPPDGLTHKRSHSALNKFAASSCAKLPDHLRYSGSANGPRYGEKGAYGPDIVPKVGGSHGSAGQSL
jgi:hypothetical protein